MGDAKVIPIQEGRLLALGFPPEVAGEAAAAHARGRFRLRPSPDIRRAAHDAAGPPPSDTNEKDLGKT